MRALLLLLVVITLRCGSRAGEEEPVVMLEPIVVTFSASCSIVLEEILVCLR